MDGEIHNYQKEHDTHRDLILSSLNLKVLRIKNEEIENMEAVKNKIREYFSELMTHPQLLSKYREERKCTTPV